MASNPTLLTMPIAENGTKNIIPENQATPGNGLMSQSTGFPAECSLPLGAGGVAPDRADFNGAFNLLGGIAFMAQKGFTFNYDATQDYYTGCVVIDGGNRYLCIADMAAGTIAPSADTTHTYWIFYPVGVINKRDVITTSGTYTAPVTGWYHITCIGGGGAGGNGGTASYGGLSGTQGGTSSFGTVCSASGGHSGAGGNAGCEGGGGAGGDIAHAFVQLTQGDAVAVTVGAGGAAPTSGTSSSAAGANGSGGAQGGTLYAEGAKSPFGSGMNGSIGGNLITGIIGSLWPTGFGGTNGTPYGGGGGGAPSNRIAPASYLPLCGAVSLSNGEAGTTITSDNGTYPKGGDGGNGAVIVEYFA